MNSQHFLSNYKCLTLILALLLFLTFLHHMQLNPISSKIIFHTEKVSVLACSNPNNNDLHNMYGWQVVGDTREEQRRLSDMSIMIAAWHPNANDNVPIVPSISADGHLLVLSAAASRVRYGASVTFLMVYPTDMKNVLSKDKPAQPLSANLLNLWCIFTDGSVTPAYSYDSHYGNDRASLLDCTLSAFAYDTLWRRNKTLTVYLASLTDKDQNAPILKAYVTVPKPALIPLNTSQQQMTLCTSPLHNGAKYLTQWIMFHFLVGFRKFVVYNSTDTQHQLQPTIDAINRQHPNLIDVMQWNFSSLALTDVMSTRYFQTEALHDCLIRYGDQSAWLGMLDLDEYIVPLPPYDSVLQFLNANYGRRIMGSVNLWSQFFCTRTTDNYNSIENNTDLLVIERFTVRAPSRHKGTREKYLYRPPFVQYLSIHHQIAGLSKDEPPADAIMLAHYATMAYLRSTPGCSTATNVNDTSIRDRFAKNLKKKVGSL